MYEYFDGENGKPLVRMNWNVARRCSAPGRVDEQIEKDVHNVVFVASDSDIRNFLSRFGSWSDEELNDVEATKRYLLWVAACDIVENPDDYDVRSKRYRKQNH
jgi:hypothetical protein